MATLEKLVRTVEALKLHQTPSVALDETMTKKEKISHCVSVTDVLCSQGLKNSPESTKYLAMAMEMYFTLLDDPDSDMRMVADENLNRAIRGLGESSVTRIQVELYKEIKKNGSSRCVRAALWRFSYLAPHIRPIKCRAYLVNLLPCISILAGRSEESVHETLSTSLPMLFKVLGSFTNDNEVKILMKSFIANVGSASAVIRRTTANNLEVLATRCRKPALFTSWLLNTIVGQLLPLSDSTSTNTVVGVLSVSRQIFPHVSTNSEETENLLRLYEICLHYVKSKDHNIINSSLETLQVMLINAPPLLSYILSTPGGITKSCLDAALPDQHTPPPDPPALHIPMDTSIHSISELVDHTGDVLLNLPDSAGANEPAESALSAPHDEQLNLPHGESVEILEEPDIGTFYGEGVSLQYLARLLVSKFLLTTEKGKTVSDSKVRVSVKTLALSCVSEILLQIPQSWFLPIILTAEEEFTSVLVSDLVIYLEHEDPGLRGVTAKLICKVLRGICIESGGHISTWFEGRQQDDEELTHMLIAALKDTSSVTVKHAISGAKLLLPKLITSTARLSAAHLLDLIPCLAIDGYWLNKVELCELTSVLDPLACTYILSDWSHMMMDMYFQLLGDEDCRVRSAAASALVHTSTSLLMSKADLPFEAAKKMYSDSETTSERESNLHQMPELPSREMIDGDVAFNVIYKIYEVMKTASSKHLLFGCIEALHQISKKYSPLKYTSIWGIHMPRVTRSSLNAEGVIQSPASTLLSTVIDNLNSVLLCTDLGVHAQLLEIGGNLYSGLVCNNLRETIETVKDTANCMVVGDTILSGMGEQLFVHTIKLLSIISHVVDDLTPQQASSKPSLPSLQTSALSPIKKKNTEPSTPVSPPPTEKGFSLKEEKKTRGVFFGNPLYIKIYDTLKSMHSVYKNALDHKTEEKLETFVSSVLSCFSRILDFSIGHDLGKYVEEYLSYIKSCMGMSSFRTLIAVQSLLRCLFKNNYPFLSSGLGCYSRVQASPSIFEVIISNPYTTFTLDHGLNIEGRDHSMHSSTQSYRLPPVRNSPFRTTSKSTDRTSLASYIRLFEPMVIKALKHYTVSCHVRTQIEVLQLLIQLIRLRVNYCLLDSDQIFTGFILKQLESIEEGQIANADELIPHIFEFLVLLSYEHYHSKVIIDIPKILHLCEGLSASGLKTCTHVVPALKIVATDLFTGRSSNGEGELETQREVVINMLLRHLNHPTVIDTVGKVLCWTSEDSGDEKYRKLSRQVLNSLIPHLCSHQIMIENEHDIKLLYKLLKSLCPGALRPCDAIMSSLLSCAVDLNSVKEIQSWLAFTIVSFIIIFQLSPEEAVLGRLQELGIMLGSGTGSSLIDTSMESSTGSDPLRQGACSPPEYTLTTFILHTVGVAVSKYHQIAFSTIDQDNTLLEWELKELLLLVIYILQSGHCPRLSKAAIYIGKNGPPGALHNVDMITDMIMQLRHKNPIIVTRWLYILILLEKGHMPIWARVLNTGKGSSRIAGADTSDSLPTLNWEVVRRASLAVISNHLVENTNDGELLAWFLSSQIKEIVQHHTEPQIQELISIIHRQAPSSGLLIESVSARWESMNSFHFMSSILECLTGTHKTHTGRVLQILISRFLVYPSLALSRKANIEACKRVEVLLGEKEEFVHEQLPQTDLANLMETLSNKKLVARYGKLVGLLNRLSVSFFDLSPIDFGEGRKFNPGTISNVELDKSWYFQQVKKYCCTLSSPQECAKLLSNLRFSDIMLILTAKDFNLRILEECLLQGIVLPDGSAVSIDSLDRLPGLLSDPERSPGLREVGYQIKEGPPLYRAASQVLLQHIKNVVELLPRPPHVYRPHRWWQITSQETRYSHRLDDFFSRPESRNLIIQLIPSISRLLVTYPRLPGRRPTLPPHSVLEMARFGVLALELVKWIVAGCREVVPGKEHILDVCLTVASLTFSNPHLSSALALPSHSVLACSAVLAISDYLVATCPDFKMPEIPFKKMNDLLLLPNPPAILVAASCLSRILYFFEKSDKTNLWMEKIFPVVVGLARLPQFISISRAPPLAFSMGWEPDLIVDQNVVMAAVPEHLLQEQEVLLQIVWRLNILGWTGRTQFEETWMCLLSVLNVSHDDLTNEEVGALSQSTALVVSALSSLLVTTLGLPVAGIPGAQLLHHPRDTPNPFLLTGRGQQLTAIQNIIHQRLEDSQTRTGLPVDSSVNLERAFIYNSGVKSGYSPVPSTRYGPGQVSLGYLTTCIAYHEEGSDDRQSLASSALPLFLLIREENLAAAGLDTNSCVHFMIDLFSQWLGYGGQDTPLTVLTAAVKSINMISDIFTQSNQFSWMLNSLSDLQKVHPPEDDLMSSLVCIGMAKSVAITGVMETEILDRIKKCIEAGLRSPHTFMRSSALHGALYLLQGDLGQESQLFLAMLVDHLKGNLMIGRGNFGVDENVLVLWSLLFYILENYSTEISDPELSVQFVQLCIATSGQPDLPRPLYTCLLAGLERLVVAGIIKGRQLEQVVKLATDLMTEWAPVSVLPAVQLFLAAMYASHPPSSDPSQRPAPITDPELLMQMMEQMSILFDCVRRAGPAQARLLSEILPQVLIDFFPASDVVNRVISEFISPGQPHPALLAGVLKQIFSAAVSQDQQGMLTEWVLVSLPNFTRRAPLSHSIWCLSCFFLAASPNPWLQAMFPHLLHRAVALDTTLSTPVEDRKLFCLAAADFYSLLSDKRQKEKFVQTFESASEPGNPYADLLSAVEHINEKNRNLTMNV